MKRTLLVLFVVGIVVGAASVGTASVGTVTDATSDAPPVESPAQENATAYPPGLSPAGVTDPLALLDAHRETLANTSYALSTTVTYRRPNGSLLASSTTSSRVAPGGSSFSMLTSQMQSNATRPLGVRDYELAVWANETTAVRAHHREGADPNYRQIARERAPFEPDTNWELLYSAFGTTNTTVVERFEADGTTLFRVVSTGDSVAYPDHERYGFTAVVDSQGVVRTFQQTFRTTFDDRPAVVSRTMQVTAIGNTTVERPDWYDKAVANATDGG